MIGKKNDWKDGLFVDVLLFFKKINPQVAVLLQPVLEISL